MINISKSGNAIKFVFTDSDHYLYGNGEIEVPVNSLSLIVDESKMVTFRKANSNDIFLSFDPANSNLSDKAGVIDFYKANMVGSTGGGGSESGITSGEVQTMIDESLEDYYTDDEVDAALSGKASASDVAALQNEVAAKADTSAVTAVANDVSTLSGQVATKVATTDFNAYSAATDARLAEDEEVTAAALNNLDENKQDALQYYSEDTENDNANITVEGTDDNGNTYSFIEAYNTDAGIGFNRTIDGNDYSNIVQVNTEGVNIQSQDGDGETYLTVTPTGVTINDERVLTESDGVYYINFATLTTQGIHDADWDGMVNAINAHRPIYAGLGGRYYTAECLYQNGGNQIIMTASDELTHYFYTFTKNGSENYSFSYDTKPYVTDTEKATWNAKQDVLSAGTGIEISGNVISATGGGGATYSAGQGINIDTANTISFAVPIYSGATGNLFHPTYNNNSILIGNNNNRASNVSVAGGNACTGQSFSFTYGQSNSATGSTSIALGNRVNATNDREAAFGSYNVSNKANTTFGDSGNTLFSVGNDNSSVRHNSFEIRQNGDIYFPDTDNTTYQNFYEKPMVRLQDMYAALGGLKFVQCSQAEYDALVSGGTVDSSTIYFITNVVS